MYHDRCLQKAQKVANDKLSRLHHLKFQISTAWGLNDFFRTPGSHGGDIAKSVMGPSVCPIAVSGWELKPNAFFGISSAPGGCAIPGLFRRILFNKIIYNI